MTRRATILIVEDDPVALQMLAEAVEDLTGHEVLLAESGAAAIEACASHPGGVELLVTDVMMPEMNGLELLERLRQTRPGLEAIFVSGLTEQNLKREGLLPENVPFLHKPFDLDALTALVSERLAGRSPAPAEASPKPLATYRYQLDADDRIVFVSDAWLAFAVQNDAPGLTREAVLGRPIWDFITGPSTRQIYEHLHEETRARQRVLTVPFRCDSPDRRRFMELELRSLPDGFIQADSRLLREEQRSPVDALRVSVERTDEFVDTCSLCRRVREDHDWAEIEDLVLRGLFHEPGPPQFTHTTCPDCEERVRDTLAGRE